MRINYGHFQDYLHGTKLNKLVERAVTGLRHIEFDTIAVYGISGLLVGAPLASAMGKGLMVVRKPSEPQRSLEEMAKMGFSDGTLNDARKAFGVLGFGNNQKILLLDDHISNGTTFKLIISAINDQCTIPSFSAVLLYYVPGWYRTVVCEPVSYTLTNPKGEKVTVPILSL